MPAIVYRTGEKKDSLRIAELIYAASGGITEFLLHDVVPGMTSIQLMARTLEGDNSHYTFRNVITACSGEEIAGIALSYPSEFHGVTEEMRAFFPKDRLLHLHDLLHSNVAGSFFLDALCVAPEFWGQGIGGKLIALTKERAGAAGAHSLSLIVLADNAPALRLYERYGFETIKYIRLDPHELIPHEGGAILMKCPLD